MTTSSENSHALPAGFLLKQYRIIRILGVGGFGITYLAEDENLKRQVAIKEYFPGEISIRQNRRSIFPKSNKFEKIFVEGVERFLNEARSLAQFNHPNIVRVQTVFTRNGTAYIVMDYYEGMTLGEYLEKQEKKLSPEKLIALVNPLMDGLEVVHNAGLIHRDIKPENIYLRHIDFPVLIDFGAARYSIGKASRSLSMILTPGYAPFEQYQTAGRSQGPWTDIYSLAATMYHCATGKIPPEASERAQAVLEDSSDPYQPIAAPGYSSNLLQAIDIGMSFRPKQRPQAVSEFRQLLTDTAPEPIHQPMGFTSSPKTDDKPPKAAEANTPPSYSLNVLASRGSRFGAAVIDNLLVTIPAFLIGFAQGARDEDTLAIGGLLMLVLVVWQAVWLTRRGQTIGKKMLKIKIVKHSTNENGGFFINVILRPIVYILLSLFGAAGNAFQMIFFIIDSLFIFRKDQRCIHDLIAGTKVVNV